MTTIINIDNLKIYRNYGGNIDGLLRMGKKSDLDAFGSDLDNIWGKITSFSQDVELIEKGLVSKVYADKSKEEIKSRYDQAAFDELTNTISTTSTNLLYIIKDYQLSADKAVQIFKDKYNVNDILEGWHSKVYEQTGKLIDEGLYFYAFHGIGLAAHFKDKFVDFDFAYFPEPRHDGFDLWRLTNFIQNQGSKYHDYKDKEKIEREFNELIKNGVIAKPKLENSTTLYFFKNALKTDIFDETERKTTGNSTLPKAGRTWLQKLFDSE